MPKSGIRSPGRGEEELGRAQAAREMVNRSLGELKTDTALWGPAGPQTDRGSSDRAGLESYRFPLKGGMESARSWVFTPEAPVISQRPHYSAVPLLAFIQGGLSKLLTARWGFGGKSHSFCYS